MKKFFPGAFLDFHFSNNNVLIKHKQFLHLVYSPDLQIYYM